MLNIIHDYSSLDEVVAEVLEVADEKPVSIVCYAETVTQIHRILARDYCLKKDLEDFDFDYNSRELYEIYFDENEVDIILLDESDYPVEIYYAYADCPCSVVEDMKCVGSVRVFDICDADDVDKGYIDELDDDEFDELDDEFNELDGDAIEEFERPMQRDAVYIVINGDVIFN